MWNYPLYAVTLKLFFSAANSMHSCKCQSLGNVAKLLGIYRLQTQLVINTSFNLGCRFLTHYHLMMIQ